MIKKIMGVLIILSYATINHMSPTLHPSIPMVIAPTAFEFATIQRVLRRSQINRKLRLGMCGVGEQQAILFCRTLDPGNISHLLLLGWAGGLIPDLAAGAVVCANKSVRTGKPGLTAIAFTINGLRIGAILTSPQALLTLAEKQAAQSCGAIAVEMEAYPFAEWAYTHGIPFTHGRVILDTMSESLPDMGQALDVYGRLRKSPFLAQLVKHPALIPEIWHLFQRTRSLNTILEQLALDLVRLI